MLTPIVREVSHVPHTIHITTITCVTVEVQRARSVSKPDVSRCEHGELRAYCGCER